MTGSGPRGGQEASPAQRWGAPLAIGFAAVVSLLLLYGATATADLRSLESARRALPPTVTWALCGAVLVIALGFAVALAVRMVLAFGTRRGASMAIVAVAIAVFGVTGTSGPMAFADVYDILGGRTAPFVTLTARWMGALGIAASLLIMAAFACTAAGGGGDTVTPESQRERVTAARELLFLSAVGLAAGTIATFARLVLQMDPALDDTGRAAALGVVQAATIGYGGFFTLLLLGSYLPASYFLSKSSAVLATASTASDADTTARSKWLTENGLEDKALTRVLKILATFLPLLTSTLSGPLASVLEKLVG